MLADATTGAELWINIRKLKADLNIDGTPPGWRCLPRPARGNGHGIAGVIRNSSATVIRRGLNRAVIVASGKPPWLEGVPVKLHIQGIGFSHQQDSAPDRVEMVPGKDGLRARGTILLADDARSVHGPR